MGDTYVALLRGINVGGHRVKMDRLRELFRELDLDQVRTYIQSGNVFFASRDRDPATLRTTIETHLMSSLGYQVPVCLRTVEQLERIVRLDPFTGVTVTPDVRLAVTFLAESPTAVPAVPYRTPDGAYEVIEATRDELFVVWRLQNGRPGSSFGLIDAQVQVPTTTRFWHTTAKILAAAQGS